MRRSIPFVVATVLLATSPAPAQFNSGSTGADGALNPSANVTLALPPSGVFHFTTVNVPSGVTVRFTRNAANTPVTMLAQGDIVIAGTLDISGSAGGAGSLTGTLLGPNGGAGGPGGFDGGTGANGVISTTGGAGLGPGGAGGGTSSGSSGGGGGHVATGGASIGADRRRRLRHRRAVADQRRIRRGRGRRRARRHGVRRGRRRRRARPRVVDDDQRVGNNPRARRQRNLRLQSGSRLRR